MPYTIKEVIVAIGPAVKQLQADGIIANGNPFVETKGENIVISVPLAKPTLHIKNKIIARLKKVIFQEISPKAAVQIKFDLTQKTSSDKSIDNKPPLAGVASVVAIASGKGGVGKSTITANLAVALVMMGYKVGILDADIYGPSIPTLMDVEGARPSMLKKEGVQKIQPVENYGVSILSIGFFVTTEQAVIWRGPMASKALNQMIFDTSWGKLDLLLVDLPPGTGDIHLSLVQALPLNGSIIVSTPQHLALADVKKGIAMFQQEQINVPVLGIIENMSYFETGELPQKKYHLFGIGGAAKLAEQKKLPLLGELPLVQTLREASDAGRPAVLQDKTPISLAFLEIAKNLIKQLEKRNKNLKQTQKVTIEHYKGCGNGKT